jgi:hypothetical protein
LLAFDTGKVVFDLGSYLLMTNHFYKDCASSCEILAPDIKEADQKYSCQSCHGNRQAVGRGKPCGMPYFGLPWQFRFLKIYPPIMT